MHGRETPKVSLEGWLNMYIINTYGEIFIEVIEKGLFSMRIDMPDKLAYYW